MVSKKVRPCGPVAVEAVVRGGGGGETPQQGGGGGTSYMRQNSVPWPMSHLSSCTTPTHRAGCPTRASAQIQAKKAKKELAALKKGKGEDPDAFPSHMRPGTGGHAAGPAKGKGDDMSMVPRKGQ